MDGFWMQVFQATGRGLVVTMQVSALSLLIGLVIGLPTALLRVYGPRWARLPAIAYVEIFRGTPLLVQLFIIYYGLSDRGVSALLASLGLPPTLLTLSPFTAAYVALGLNSGAYQAEYFRGALQAISSGQMIAARALGMTRLQAIRHIILPQAIRLALPPWSNEVAYMVKYTSIVSLIAVQDLFGEIRSIISAYYNPMVMLPYVGLVYLLIVMALSWVMGRVEAKFRIPGLEVEFDRT